MADNIPACQPAEGDILNPSQDIDRHLQSALCLKRKVLLRKVPGYDNFGAESDSCQKHLHLGRRRILGLIENNERIIQCSASHIRQRNHLYYTLLSEPCSSFDSEHIV